MEPLNISRPQRDLLDALKNSIVAIDKEKAQEEAQKIIEGKIDTRIALEYSIAESAKIIGDKFDRGEYYLPHLVMAGDLMEEVSAILEKNISAEQIEKKKIIVIRWRKYLPMAWGRMRTKTPAATGIRSLAAYPRRGWCRTHRSSDMTYFQTSTYQGMRQRSSTCSKQTDIRTTRAN